MPTIDGRRVTFGRCFWCEVAYRWSGAPRLRDAICPNCLRHLRATTHLLKSVPWRDKTPFVTGMKERR